MANQTKFYAAMDDKNGPGETDTNTDGGNAAQPKLSALVDIHVSNKS